MMATKHPALFLDRDGVVNVDRGYVSRIDDFEFIEGIFELCREAKRRGYLIFIVTNQAGIARGYYSEQNFLELTAWMESIFLSEGIGIDKVYFSPYHPDYGIGGYKKDTDCRKPKPGMILNAVSEFNIDVSNSVLVGDKATDIAAALAAGIRTRLLFLPSSGKQYDFTCEDASGVVTSLADVVQFL